MIKLVVGHPAGNEVHLSYGVLTEKLHYKILMKWVCFYPLKEIYGIWCAVDYQV